MHLDEVFGIDPLTTFVFAILMMLLNGGVLGLVRRELPQALQSAADDWRIATLMVACGMVLFMAQEGYAAWFMRPTANVLLTLALIFYGRGLRRFYGLPDRYWVLLVALVAALGVLWFDVAMPSARGRILVSSLCWLFILGDTLRMMVKKYRGEVASHRIMVFIYGIIWLFVAVRTVWLVWFLEGSHSPLDGAALVNTVTPLVMSILPVIGTTVFLLMCSDRITRDWERAASTDYLTGLANRRAFADEGARLLREASERSKSLALAVVDIDHFKRINDRHGHDVGDDALRHVADLLRRIVRTSDLIVRQGGEEFVVVMAGIAPDEAYRRMEGLRALFADRAFVSGEHTLPITVSIGVTWRDDNDSRILQLLHRADAALYRAKKGGRNRVEMADPAEPV